MLFFYKSLTWIYLALGVFNNRFREEMQPNFKPIFLLKIFAIQHCLFFLVGTYWNQDVEGGIRTHATFCETY